MYFTQASPDEHSTVFSTLISAMELSKEKTSDYAYSAICRIFCMLCGLAVFLQDYLTQRINQMVLESQLPHKIVNLLIAKVIANTKLNILLGS